MKKRNPYYLLATVVLSMLLSAGCASVPKEVVTLSYRMGEDIQSLQLSYDQLIQEYYTMLRNERRSYLDNEWYPRFLENWREGGELLAIAKGEKIWSVEKQQLIPTPPDATDQETLKTLQDWLDYALYAYEVKEDTLMASLNTSEAQLRRDVNSAFQQIVRANAAITAHLNSIREVKEVQDAGMEAMGIGELRDRINSALISASQEADQRLQQIREADARVENLLQQVEGEQ